MKTITQLFENIPNANICGNASIAINNLCTDSRRAIPGTLFFAIDGLRTAGTIYAEDAIKNGAIAIVISKKSAENLNTNFKNITTIVVDDVLKTIPFVANNFYGVPANAQAFPHVGITGTNGKTSISSIVRYLMMKQSQTPWGLIGTVRYELGKRSIPSYKTTPEALDLAELFYEMRQANCAGTIMEVSSHAICQNRVYGLNFDVVAFSNLTQDHIDYHGDMQHYFEAKKRLFDGSQGTFPRVAVINADDDYGKKLIESLAGTPSKIITFGIHENATFKANEIALAATGTTFKLKCPAGTHNVATQLPGFYNVSNTLCALAIVDALGGNLKQAIEDIKNFAGVAGRMERVDGNAFPFEIFIDYAHTDDALTNALSMLKSIAKGRLFCVFGCGGNRDRAKRPKMVCAVQTFADFAWATSDNPRKEPLEQIFADMKTGILDETKIVFEPDRRRAIALAIDAARENDIILIAGKGHENYQIFADITLPFDDKLVAQELLALKKHRV